METIDYIQPLRLECVAIEPISGLGHSQIQTVEYIAYIRWEDIRSIEGFTKTFLFPKDHRPKIVITTINQTAYIVVGEDVEQASIAWAKYKVWANSLRNLIFTQN